MRKSFVGMLLVFGALQLSQANSAALLPPEAITLTFDDVPSHMGNDIEDVIGTEYSHLGVHFNSDGRHSGIVRMNGPTDPGNWNLVGSNGPQFLGHNDYGRTGMIEFDMPISGFRVDAAHGHLGVRDLTFEAYSSAGLLETVTLHWTAPEVWETITLSSTGITRIEYYSPSNFGLDNMQFVPEPRTFTLLALSSLALVIVRRCRSKKLAVNGANPVR